MFNRLFMEYGLSLDRLRALVEVGAAGSIVKAAGGDPIRQSQYSRQIKELEDFFRITLVERHGKGIRLTPNGRELARISRFFLLGLSNFQRGSLAEEQTYRIGASATFLATFLLPVLAAPRSIQPGISYSVETVTDDVIERRLHDLTLDFGVVTSSVQSRPLQSRELGGWRLKLWVPKALFKTRAQAARAFREKRLPLVLPVNELPPAETALNQDWPRYLTCNSFLEAKAALEQRGLAALLPDFLSPPASLNHQLSTLNLSDTVFHYRFVWNPRLLRLNPHATRRRDFLVESLVRKF
jgi:DNA-binding transcriptional LysR family regulator